MSAKEGEKEAEKEGEKKDNNTSQVGAHCSMNDLSCLCVPFIGLFAVCFFFQYVRLVCNGNPSDGSHPLLAMMMQICAIAKIIQFSSRSLQESATTEEGSQDDKENTE